jgi:KaiC/GvpD/RAD55 family RecA-like ATPase
MCEGTYKIFRTGVAIGAAVVVAEAPVDGKTTMSSESVCQVARSWVDVGVLNAFIWSRVFRCRLSP